MNILKKRVKFFLGLFFFLLNSCSNQELSPTEFVKWVDNAENGLIKSQVIGETNLEVKYTPNEYIYVKQNGVNDLTSENLDEFSEELEGIYQFNLKFSNSSRNNFLKDQYTNPEEYNTKSMYLSFDMSFDLELVHGLDTVGCSIYHYERTYGNTPYETVLIGFDLKTKATEDMQLIFNDRVFGLGRSKFLFEKDVTQKLPTVKI